MAIATGQFLDMLDKLEQRIKEEVKFDGGHDTPYSKGYKQALNDMFTELEREI